MELNLNGKVVVVTGGSSGIGEETAMEFAREGCQVTIASRSEKKLAEAAGRFEAEGFQVHTQVVDVSKRRYQRPGREGLSAVWPYRRVDQQRRREYH